MQIQIDMFAVELGAALLLQFQTKNGIVRVLADAGEARYNVSKRLAHATQIQDGANTKIDLLIGTHYDADHLGGLVDIVNDPLISIGEAWLPPVANDTEVRAFDDTPEDSNLLALQFASDEGEQMLATYLEKKAHTCEMLARMEQQEDPARERGLGPSLEEFLGVLRQQFLRPTGGRATVDNTVVQFFQRHLKDAERVADIASTSHGDEQIHSPWDSSGYTEQDFYLDPEFWGSLPLSARRRGTAALQTTTLALIRRATAKDAINATSLAAVVNALKAKGVKIRCATIPDGKPRRFYWDPNAGRFSPIKASSSTTPELLLLGPSDGLVKKFWSRLPIGTYRTLATLALLPIKPITASNQLSYIMVFEHKDQRILISGDAGCVDFKPGRSKPYFAELIDALSPLQVVQVAHHAGNNAHFYRCLIEADFAGKTSTSFLLLSHATQDKKRPSDVFGKFIEQLNSDNDRIQLLFTSTPLESKVRDFKALIASVVGASDMKGDVRLSFDGAWKVVQHAVDVP